MVIIITKNVLVENTTNYLCNIQHTVYLHSVQCSNLDYYGFINMLNAIITLITAGG